MSAVFNVECHYFDFKNFTTIMKDYICTIFITFNKEDQKPESITVTTVDTIDLKKEGYKLLIVKTEKDIIETWYKLIKESMSKIIAVHKSDLNILVNRAAVLKCDIKDIVSKVTVYDAVY